MVTNKDEESQVLHVHGGDFTEAFLAVTDYFLNDGFVDKRLDLELSGQWSRGNLKMIDTFCAILERYASQLEYEKKIITNAQRGGQSFFRALILTAPFHEHAPWDRILRNHKIMSIFEQVHFKQNSHGRKRREIPAEIMHLVQDLAEKRYIKGLEFHNCRLSTSNIKVIGKMIESNLLESLEIFRTGLFEPALACGILSESLKNLHQRLPQETTSCLKNLILDEMRLNLDGNADCFFSAIENLQNLNSFGLLTKKPNVLRALGNNLKKWKRLHAVHIAVGREEAEWDFQAFFRAVELSSVKDFWLSRHDSGSNLPATESAQLFDLAFSTKSQLLAIDVGRIDPSLLSSLIPKSSDKERLFPQLRTFKFLDEGGASQLLEDDDHQRRLGNLQALFDVVKTHLPFLHNLGLDVDQMKNCSKKLEEGSTELALWTRIIEQLGKNKVGIALLDSRTSDVPRGLWAYLFEQTSFSYAKRDDAAIARNYQLIQALCKAGISGVSECRGADPPDKGCYSFDGSNETGASDLEVNASKRRRHI